MVVNTYMNNKRLLVEIATDNIAENAAIRDTMLKPKMKIYMDNHTAVIGDDMYSEFQGLFERCIVKEEDLDNHENVELEMRVLFNLNNGTPFSSKETIVVNTVIPSGFRFVEFDQAMMQTFMNSLTDTMKTLVNTTYQRIYQKNKRSDNLDILDRWLDTYYDFISYRSGYICVETPNYIFKPVVEITHHNRMMSKTIRFKYMTQKDNHTELDLSDAQDEIVEELVYKLKNSENPFSGILNKVYREEDKLNV